MVSLVIVAHSAALAESLRDLAAQVAQGRVGLAVAGGTGDPTAPLGTDALCVLHAIESVYSEEGVLVLTDLGSALLSAETAIDMLPAERRGHIALSAAPLVEGAVAAAVQASLGASLEAVESEAVHALDAKLAHLGLKPGSGTVGACMERAPSPPRASATLTVSNALGIHARPAAALVSTAAKFKAEVSLRNLTRGRGPADARSITQVSTLDARRGDRLLLEATGPSAEEAISALRALAEAGFGETGEEPAAGPRQARGTAREARARRPRVLVGVPASPGIACGEAVRWGGVLPRVEARNVTDPAGEVERLGTALARAREEIAALMRRSQPTPGRPMIFEAHLLFLGDPDIVEGARARIRQGGISAEAAWDETIREVAASYGGVADPYLRAREVDVRDVGRRVLGHLLGLSGQVDQPSRPGIILVEDLMPSEAAQLDPSLVLGVVAVFGGPTGHASILVRAMGIPEVVGVGSALLDVPSGTLIALDGDSGQVWVAPTAEEAEGFRERASALRARQAEMLAQSHAPAVTLDGHHVQVVANVGSQAEVRLALERGAEGIGVLRTEFLYLGRTAAPSEGEQLRAYDEIFSMMAPRPVVVRTLDVGGDKSLPYIALPAEANPFLGLRGIRVSLANGELFSEQVRAVLRASRGREVRILFPMIATLEELRLAKELVGRAQEDVARDAGGEAGPLKIGIMVEVPSIALLAERVVREVDFISIGTNDLTQYVFAAERGNERLADLGDACHPAVLRLVQGVLAAAQARNVWAAVCGELAADPEGIPILLGLGVDELSMAPAAIPRAKGIIRLWALETAREMAFQALARESAREVRALVRRTAAQGGVLV